MAYAVTRLALFLKRVWVAPGGGELLNPFRGLGARRNSMETQQSYHAHKVWTGDRKWKRGSGGELDPEVDVHIHRHCKKNSPSGLSYIGKRTKKGFCTNVSPPHCGSAVSAPIARGPKLQGKFLKGYNHLVVRPIIWISTLYSYLKLIIFTKRLQNIFFNQFLSSDIIDLI